MYAFHEGIQEKTKSRLRLKRGNNSDVDDVPRKVQRVKEEAHETRVDGRDVSSVSCLKAGREAAQKLQVAVVHGPARDASALDTSTRKRKSSRSPDGSERAVQQRAKLVQE